MFESHWTKRVPHTGTSHRHEHTVLRENHCVSTHHALIHTINISGSPGSLRSDSTANSSEPAESKHLGMGPGDLHVHPIPPVVLNQMVASPIHQDRPTEISSNFWQDLTLPRSCPLNVEWGNILIYKKGKFFLANLFASRYFIVVVFPSRITGRCPSFTRSLQCPSGRNTQLDLNPQCEPLQNQLDELGNATQPSRGSNPLIHWGPLSHPSVRKMMISKWRDICHFV